ncbi:MAG: hypothetical protein LBG81_00700 [Coriobacteriaceae bacterium]|nr:hypothetical protein [Coriobacteriaceae bacterium]
MGRLKVADAEYALLQEQYAALGEKFEESYREYCGALTEVCHNAISEGEVFENLQAFAAAAGALQGRLAEVLSIAGACCTDFIGEVDQADEYLY